MKKRKKNERKIKFKAHSIFGMATRKASQCEYTDNLLDENVRRTRSTGLLIVNIQTFVFLLFGLSFVRFRWFPVSLPLSLSLSLCAFLPLVVVGWDFVITENNSVVITSVRWLPFTSCRFWHAKRYIYTIDSKYLCTMDWIRLPVPSPSLRTLEIIWWYEFLIMVAFNHIFQDATNKAVEQTQLSVSNWRTNRPFFGNKTMRDEPPIKMGFRLTLSFSLWPERYCCHCRLMLLLLLLGVEKLATYTRAA